MPAKRTVIIGSADAKNLRDVIVREVPVGKIRDYLIEHDNQPRDFFAAVAFEDCGLDDLAFMSNATVVELEGFPPSELETLRVACKEINPAFFRCRAMVDTAARSLQAELQQMQSTAIAASSSASTATETPGATPGAPTR